MKKKLSNLAFIVTAISLLAGSLNFSFKSSKAETVEPLSMVFAPRLGMAANFRVPTKYSSIRVQWGSTTSNNKHVRVLARANTDKDCDTIDLSSYNRIELLVMQGTNQEYFSPFLVDADGDMYFFGTGDGNNYVAGSEWFNGKEIACPNTNLDPITLGNKTQCNYSGVPAYCEQGKEDFVYYHFSLENHSEKPYTDWKEGLGLSANSNFDFSHVKLCGFNMCKQDGNNQHDWDFGIVSIFGRKQTSNSELTSRVELFNAEKAVITNSNSTLWNDGWDDNNNSYVFVQNNADLGLCTVTIEHNQVAQTKSVDMPVENFLTSGKVELVDIDKGQESVWLWSYVPNLEKSVSLDLSNYDGWMMDIKNLSDVSFPINFYQLDSSKNQCQAGSYIMISKDGSIVSNDTRTIPANFEGTLYSLFEGYTLDLLTHLDSAINETRIVFSDMENLDKVSFEFNNFSYISNAKEIAKAKVNAIGLLNDSSVDDYREGEKNEYLSFIEDAYDRIYGCRFLSEVEAIINEFKSIKTNNDYIIEEIKEKIEAGQNELENYINALIISGNYYEEEIDQLEEVLENGKTEIGSCTSEQLVNETVAKYKALADEVFTKSEIDANKLNIKKEAAIAHINSVDLNLYREAEKNEMISLQNKAISDVNKATTENEVDAIISQFDVDKASIKTDAQLIQEELASYKQSSIQELTDLYNNLLNNNSYREEEKTRLDSILNTATSDINNASTKSDILMVVTIAKQEMNALKTEADYQQEELELAKANAKQEARIYYNSINLNLYSESNRSAIESIYQNVLQQIDNASSQEELANIINQMKNDIGSIKKIGEEDEDGCGGSIACFSITISSFALMFAFIGLNKKKRA